MNRIGLISTVALLVAGCASRGAFPAASAQAPQAQAATPETKAVELRHFYLLSPGPSATLVVTRSDLASGAPESN